MSTAETKNLLKSFIQLVLFLFHRVCCVVYLVYVTSDILVNLLIKDMGLTKLDKQAILLLIYSIDYSTWCLVDNDSVELFTSCVLKSQYSYVQVCSSFKN